MSALAASSAPALVAARRHLPRSRSAARARSGPLAAPPGRAPRAVRRLRAAVAAEAVETASIGDTFADLKARGQCAFVPFICAGDPNLGATAKALKILDDAGADVIELGVPYSDPLADGPTIQVRAPRSPKRNAPGPDATGTTAEATGRRRTTPSEPPRDRARIDRSRTHPIRSGCRRPAARGGPVFSIARFGNRVGKRIPSREEKKGFLLVGRRPRRLDRPLPTPPSVDARTPRSRASSIASRLPTPNAADHPRVQTLLPPLPLPDRPNQAAATRALAAGTTLRKTIDLLADVSPTIKAPIVLFTYYNPIYQRGFEAFVADIAKAGAKGLLVPDIPLEETPALSEICASRGVDLVLLSTPTTPVERAKKIALASNGFIYLVSVTGVTGARSDVESRVQELVTTLKEVTEKPVCVGFGISKEAQAREVVEFGADGVIVGSALVRALGEAESEEAGLEKLEALAKELRRGANRV